MNVCFSSNFALGISSVLSSLFPRILIFFAVSNGKPTQIIETVKQISRYLIYYADLGFKYLQIIMTQCTVQRA